MAILLLADHDNKSLSDQTAKALSAAQQIGGDVHILVAGSSCESVAAEAAKLAGAAKVLLGDSGAGAEYVAGGAESLAGAPRVLSADPEE